MLIEAATKGIANWSFTLKMVDSLVAPRKMLNHSSASSINSTFTNAQFGDICDMSCRFRLFVLSILNSLH